MNRWQSFPLWGRTFNSVLAALILFKLWLVAGLPLEAQGHLQVDDALYIRLAQALLDGQWLGTYDYLTLAKGPMYPMFVAAASALRLPLFIAQNLFYALACIVALRAWKPFHPKPWLAVAAFTVLFFNPYTFSYLVTRDNLSPTFSLLIFGSAAGILFRYRERKRTLLKWSLPLGLGLSGIWLLREDSVWVVPGLFLLLTFIGWRIFRDRRPDWKWRTAILLSPVIMVAAAVVAVSLMNLRYYHVFTLTEMNQPTFKRAYRELTRIKPQVEQRYVPMTREVQERLYPLSPIFAQLRPHLEGAVGARWAKSSQKHTNNLASGEIAGGWFVWALRESVGRSGNAEDGRIAQIYYNQLEREVNRFITNNNWPADKAGATLAPPWREHYTVPTLLYSAAGLLRAMTFYGGDRQAGPSGGDQTIQRQFAAITHERLFVSESSLTRPTLNRPRLVRVINYHYQIIIPTAIFSAVFIWLLRRVLTVRRKIVIEEIVITAAVIASISTLMIILGFVSASSFFAIRSAYHFGASTLILFLVAIFIMTAVGQPHSKHAK